MNPVSRELENRRMLAAVLGIDEEEAADRLSATALVTHAADEASRKVGEQVLAMLARTVHASFEIEASAPAVEVVVGNASPRYDVVPHIWVGQVAEGVLISSERFPRIDWHAHPIFGLIAACYATGMALRYAIGCSLPFPSQSRILVSPSDLLGADEVFLSMPCDLGETVLAGAGAVGNGFLYGLQHFDVRGTLHVVDPKHVHDGILNRCIWFTERDRGGLKADAIVLRAQRAFPSLTLVPQHSTLKDFTIAAGAPALKRLVSTVDSRRARRSLQNEIPRDVFDASTTGIAEVVLHFNEQPSMHACLSCIYRQDAGDVAHEAHVAEALGVHLDDVRKGFIDTSAAEKICRWATDLDPQQLIGKAYDTLFKARCAAGKLRTAEDRQVLATFCNVSMLAGAFLSLEMVRRINAGSVVEPFNYWRLSPWHSPVVALRSTRLMLQGCEFCGNPLNRKVASDIWGRSH